MYFERCEIPQTIYPYKRSSNVMLLEKFIETNIPCAIIKDSEHTNKKNCASSLASTARRMGMGNVVVRFIRGEVYLMRKDKIDNLK